MAFDNSRNANPIYRTKAHKKARAALLEQHSEGDPCCLCQHPMLGPTRGLHADHCPACLGDGCEQCAGLGYRGLAHGYPCEVCGRSCNQHDGAVRGNKRRKENRVTRWVL